MDKMGKDSAYWRPEPAPSENPGLVEAVQTIGKWTLSWHIPWRLLHVIQCTAGKGMQIKRAKLMGFWRWRFLASRLLYSAIYLLPFALSALKANYCFNHFGFTPKTRKCFTLWQRGWARRQDRWQKYMYIAGTFVTGGVPLRTPCMCVCCTQM